MRRIRVRSKNRSVGRGAFVDGSRSFTPPLFDALVECMLRAGEAVWHVLGEVVTDSGLEHPVMERFME